MCRTNSLMHGAMLQPNYKALFTPKLMKTGPNQNEFNVIPVILRWLKKEVRVEIIGTMWYSIFAQLLIFFIFYWILSSSIALS